MQPVRNHKPGRRHRREPEAAFTLVELLVVLAVVGLLACLAIPTVAGTKWPVKRVQCAGNLRQLTLAMLIYGNENNNKLPSFTSGAWAWDIPVSTTDLLDRYGAHRQQLYCPAFPEQNDDIDWNFTSTVRVTGYAYTFSGTVISQYQNPSIIPQSRVIGSFALPVPQASQRVLIADVVINTPRTDNNTNYATMLTYQWIEILGGSPVHHRTSHLNGYMPSGGNAGMLDGHVEWHDIRGMIPRTTSGPNFWW